MAGHELSVQPCQADILGPSDDDALVQQLTRALAPAYRIRCALGGGTFGSVFLALQADTGQDVALKVLRPQAGWSPATAAARVAHFEREAALCTGLHHPHIARLLHTGCTSEGLCYAVYELVTGETLRRLLQREGALTVARSAELMGQVLGALATAHAQGVVHRDLKPENVMVSDNGGPHAKVLDFGIGSLTLEARDTAFHDRSRRREPSGTPFYRAPEQLRGDPPTATADLYAWGLLFLECLTGRRAISGSTQAEVYHQHLSSREIPLPPSIAEHALGRLLRRVLRKDPRRRADDAAGLYAELRRLPLGDLAGELGGSGADDETTSWRAGGRVQHRQVTAIALVLQLHPLDEDARDPSTLDAILTDQLGLCRDALTRYGGTVIGQLGDQLLAMHGIPTPGEADARLALRTVLDLAGDLRERSERLISTSRLSLHFRLGMYAGPVMAGEGQAAAGMTSARALALAATTAIDTIRVSSSSRRLLEPFAEFEPCDPVELNGALRPLPTSRLLGERAGEARSFRPRRAGGDPLVDRDAELTRLRELDAQQGAGRPRAVLLRGEAGIGKSHLIREFLRDTCRGRAIHEFPCRRELQGASLGAVLPAVRRFLPGAAQAGRDPRDPAQDALVETLASAEAVLVFEDLHWADPATLALLERLLAREYETPPLVLATARPEFDPPPGASARMPSLQLTRLSSAGATRLATAVWGSTPPQPTLAAIVERAGGVPLFVEELARTLRGDREQGRDVDPNELPTRLRGLLEARLARLGQARLVAQLAAVLGWEFERGLLFACAGEAAGRVEGALEQLVQTRLLYRRRRADAATYAFRHPLIREVSYETMAPERRRETHARVARVLAAQFPALCRAQPGELARHRAAAAAGES